MTDKELRTAGPGHQIIQRLLMGFAQQKTFEPAEPRNIVSRGEAKVALLILAASIDANFQTGHLDDFSTETAMGAAVVIWEALEPLSEDVANDDSTVEEFLRTYMAAMRQVRTETGL
jgi:hypothetical protein